MMPRPVSHRTCPTPQLIQMRRSPENQEPVRAGSAVADNFHRLQKVSPVVSNKEGSFGHQLAETA